MTDPLADLPPLPPKWSAPLSVTCKCPVVTGGPMLVPDCPIHAGPFGREVARLRVRIERARALEAGKLGADDAIGRLIDEHSTTATAFYAGVSFALARVRRELDQP